MKLNDTIQRHARAARARHTARLEGKANRGPESASEYSPGAFPATRGRHYRDNCQDEDGKRRWYDAVRIPRKCWENSPLSRGPEDYHALNYIYEHV